MPTSPFRPAWWIPGGNLQTLAGKYLRRVPPVHLSRERWDTPDGDFLDLDFGPDPSPESPLILILHGLEGFSRRPYVLCALGALLKAGMASVALNFRGCSGSPNLLPRLYHSGETEDPRFVLETLRDRWPGRPMGILGFSLGGNVLLKLLGEDEAGGKKLVGAGVAISVPYDLSAGVAYLESKPVGKFYTQYFLRSLKGKLRAKEKLLAPLLDLEGAMAAQTLRDFDDRATAPLHGFLDSGEYYSQASSNRFLPSVRVPTLLIHARNDPFLPPQAIPRKSIEENLALTPLISGGGGHVGFISGVLPGRPRFWAEECLATFFRDRLAPSDPG